MSLSRALEAMLLMVTEPVATDELAAALHTTRRAVDTAVRTCGA